MGSDAKGETLEKRGRDVTRVKAWKLYTDTLSWDKRPLTPDPAAESNRSKRQWDRAVVEWMGLLRGEAVVWLPHREFTQKKLASGQTDRLTSGPQTCQV